MRVSRRVKATCFLFRVRLTVSRKTSSQILLHMSYLGRDSPFVPPQEHLIHEKPSLWVLCLKLVSCYRHEIPDYQNSHSWTPKRVLHLLHTLWFSPNTQQEKSTQKAHHQPCLKWRLLPLRLCPWENSNCNLRRSSPTVYCHGLNTRRALCWSPSGASWEYTRLCSSYFSATLLAGLDSKEWYLMSRSQPIVHLTLI